MLYLVWEMRKPTFQFLVFHVGKMNLLGLVLYTIETGNSHKAFQNLMSVSGYTAEKWEALDPGECVTPLYSIVQKHLSSH